MGLVAGPLLVVVGVLVAGRYPLAGCVCVLAGWVVFRRHLWG